MGLCYQTEPIFIDPHSPLVTPNYMVFKKNLEKIRLPKGENLCGATFVEK